LADLAGANAAEKRAFALLMDILSK